MTKLLPLVVSIACCATWLPARAQTPALNPMPDGSRDMYVGLGAQSMPRYDGADSRKVSVLPVIQVEWSNGVFISGMRAGMHLSDSPSFEYGPLLGVLPGRDDSGTDGGAAGVTELNSLILTSPIEKQRLARGQGLAGMDDVRTRVQAGAFANYYLTPEWRITATALYGSGRDHDGARLELGVQRLAAALGERHHVSLGAGLTVVNRKDNETWFGVTREEAARTFYNPYQPGGGLQDVHVGARWTWALTPSWILTSNLQAKRLLGSADKSPLVERSTNLTVSTAIAYRF